MQNIEKLKYPIGTFKIPENISKEDITLWITQLKSFSGKIKTSSTSTIRHAIRYALQAGWMDYETANEQVISLFT